MEYSSTVEAIIRQLDFNLVFTKKLVEDLGEEQMTIQPSPGFENSPAFTIGHLVTGSALMIEDLGGVYEVPENWTNLFQRKGPGDPRLPESNPELYPTKKELLDEFTKQHEKLKAILLSTDEKKFSEKIKWRFNDYFPTIIDLTVFMCINHEAMHLGQLSAWRRAMKLPSALASV